MIEIIVNGERQSIPNGLNVKEMIEALDHKGEGFALAINGTFVALSKSRNLVSCLRMPS